MRMAGPVWRYLWASPVTLFGLLAVVLSLVSGGGHGRTPEFWNVTGGLLACY